MRIRNFVPLFAVLFFQPAHSQFCYYPGANAQAQDHRPCDEHAVTSLCCPIGWACFSNKLCVVTDANAVNHTVAAGTTIRGTCTDPRWNSTVCGDFCLNEPVNDNDGTLVPCGNNVFACKPEADSGLADCAAGKDVFSLTQGTLQTVVGQSTIGSTATSSVPVSSTASMTTRLSMSTSHAPSSPTPTPTPAGHKSKIGVIVGPTIAVIAIIAIIIGILLWCFPKNRRTVAATNVPSSNPIAPYNYGNGNGDANTFASETSTLAPFPHPYSPPASPPPQMNRSQVHVFGNLGIPEDDPYQQALKPPEVYNVQRRAVGEMRG